MAQFYRSVLSLWAGQAVIWIPSLFFFSFWQRVSSGSKYSGTFWNNLCSKFLVSSWKRGGKIDIIQRHAGEQCAYQRRKLIQLRAGFFFGKLCFQITQGSWVVGFLSIRCTTFRGFHRIRPGLVSGIIEKQERLPLLAGFCFLVPSCLSSDLLQDSWQLCSLPAAPSHLSQDSSKHAFFFFLQAVQALSSAR